MSSEYKFKKLDMIYGKGQWRELDADEPINDGDVVLHEGFITECWPGKYLGDHPEGVIAYGYKPKPKPKPPVKDLSFRELVVVFLKLIGLRFLATIRRSFLFLMRFFRL